MPLDEFVRARSARGKELIAEGDREGAAAVRALRKPSAAAWALDRLAAEQPALVEEIIAAAERAADTQHEVLSGRRADQARRQAERMR